MREYPKKLKYIKKDTNDYAARTRMYFVGQDKNVREIEQKHVFVKNV